MTAKTIFFAVCVVASLLPSLGWACYFDLYGLPRAFRVVGGIFAESVELVIGVLVALILFAAFRASVDLRAMREDNKRMRMLLERHQGEEPANGK